MTTRWKVFDVNQAAHYDELPLTNVPLFQEEEFLACLQHLLDAVRLSGRV